MGKNNRDQKLKLCVFRKETLKKQNGNKKEYD